MNMVRAGGRRTFLALTGILCLCGAASVATQLQRGQSWKCAIRRGGVAAQGEILSQGNEFQGLRSARHDLICARLRFTF
jgi:hypothetical protein